MTTPSFESFLRRTLPGAQQGALPGALPDTLPGALPGAEAQYRMAPRPKDGPWLYPRHPGQPLRQSAVLIPLIQAGASYDLLFTLRQPHIRHGGQWSFPGGILKREEHPKQAALRETEEEIGVPADRVDCLGLMTPLYMDPTGTLVTPVVGLIRELPDLRLQVEEVSDVMRVGIDDLLDPARRKTEDRVLRDSVYEVPYWDLHPTPLWGATAMMLSEFLAVYEAFLASYERLRG